MAYYFAVETEENSYLAKNIRSSKSFGRENSTQKAYACTLSEIDFFTSSFKDELELKTTLLKEGIITEGDINKNLAIFLSSEKEQRLVSNVILYENNRSMLYNPKEVVEYINKMAKSLNFEFFTKLEAIQEDNSKSKALIKTILSIIENKQNHQENEIGNTQIIDAISNLLIYEIKRNKKGIDMCSQDVNYEKLHNLIAFINDYELSLNKSNQNILKKIK